jgi:GrpB-like predicted nucleotidyltransferase (UPF0157 family)
MTISVVELQPYNPDWEHRFEWEKKSISEALGDSLIEVEHIGSTSIKGLAAKPIIDIMAGVHNLELVDAWIPSLMEIDYEFVHKPEFTDRRFFRKGLWGQGICHLHICEYDSTEWREKLLFRNYLRLHPEALREYASLKEELAQIHKFDRHAYTERKGPFIKKIIEMARGDEQNTS